MPAAAPIEFRMLQPMDMQSVLSIEAESFPNAWDHGTLDHFLLDPRAWSRVALENGVVVAFIVTLVDGRKMRIANLAVRGDRRRRGIARALLEHVAAAAESLGLNELALEVRESNLAGQLLYRSAGFRAVIIRRRYYGDEDGYEMRRPLGPKC